MEASAEQRVYAYAESKALNYIAGAEVLKDKALKEGGGEGDEEEGGDEEGDDEEEDEEEEEGDSDDDSEGWVDVPQSEDEMELEKSKGGEENELTPEELLEKARLISSERILTQEEFQKVKLAQLSKQVRAAKPRRFAKFTRTEEPDVLPNLATKEIVSLGAIERLYRRSKADKEARMESVKGGREDRGKFGARKGKLSEHASRSKREQTKTKAFMMIKHKLSRKKKKSFREKQVSLRNALVKRCKAA
ncbi:PREDICTED: protein SDA1 homolog [Rhagoletis zephyria]|uniref:protein SDA1 homolog n=1 Tax=Rhagoletis zephyria TaxID=28612 RepID=UPI0008113F86|nr:PREDICTED: protein SDA1 homolog [Rhagoletis zephyria]